MLFNSHIFIFAFLPLVLAGFFAAASLGGRRPAILLLVAASLFFYGWWNPAFLLLLGISVAVNYSLGLAIAAAHSAKGSRSARPLLWLGVAVNLGLIGYFKYAGFLAGSVNGLIGTHLDAGGIVLPLAISFFTFQQIAYLVDLSQGEPAERDFARYCLFVVFFPQLIAGPIVHHREMLPQFAEDRTFLPRADNLAIGFTIFVIGLFKKVVIADNLATVATPVFGAAESGADLHFFQAWGGAFAYSLQLYFDFSGYSDMAIGIARLFGIKLPLNFDAPYRATSIIDFWRRWHMTLSRFLRDYLYIPLGGGRRGPVRRHVNLMITMLLGGLWHGAGWTFVVWGGLHGAMLVVNHLWRGVFPRPLATWWSVAFARLFTFLAVTLAWVFFRAESFQGALNVFSGMVNLPQNLPQKLGPVADVLLTIGFRFEGAPYVGFEDKMSILWLAFWIGFLWIMPTTQALLRNFNPAFAFRAEAYRPQIARIAGEFPGAARLQTALAWQPTVAWAAATAVIAAIAFLSLTRVSEFLYFQF
ncbi:MBOAT family protein [Pelagibius sp. 7325]|uniref:MBOAT family O-acyltransferase n=1 Tax=Pelagibius sp. 7325 TaxID=3131994 RepID=UPI0030EC9E76